MAYYTTIIASKSFGTSGLALLEVDTDTLCVSVEGRFRDGGRSFCGPGISCLTSLPPSLLQEVEDREKVWLNKPEMSEQLRQFVDECWQQAQEMEPWFDF